MSLVLSAEGAQALVSVWNDGRPPFPWNVHLFGELAPVNHQAKYADYAPFEIAAGTAWYQPQPLSYPDGWTFTPNPNGINFTPPPVSWQVGGVAAIYGYFVSDNINQTALFAELFPLPYQYTATGGFFSLTFPLYQISLP